MNTLKDFEVWENRIRQLAAEQDYPATPDLAPAVLARMSRPGVIAFPALRWLAALLLGAVLLAALVQPVRATLLRAIQVGAIRILGDQRLPELQATTTPLLQNLAGRTTLAAARESVDFSVPIPANWPPPDYVFRQDFEEIPVIVLVWLDQSDPENTVLSLQLIGSSEVPLADKLNLQFLEATQVDGQPAAWVEGPHAYRQITGGTTFLRIVEGNVLIWTRQGVTYRLESSFSRERSVSIAESLE